jgi:NitT/TauT family transport system substrate-binding protein
MMASSADTAGALRIYGNLSLLEMAPVLLVARRNYSGKTVLEHGGVMSLWGKANDLPSLDAIGKSDLATNSETQVLRSSYANPDLRMILTVAECPYRIVARRSAGIAALADLRGKRIGVMRKSSAEYFLDRLLRTVGFTTDDATLVPFMAKTTAPLTQMPPALRSGQLDAMTVWEPQMQRAVNTIGADAIVFCDPAVYSERFNLCTTQANLENPALRPKIVAFVRALIAATDELQRAPQAAQQLVAQAAELDIETVKNAWPYLTYPARLSPDLADILLPVDVWVAKETRRAARTRGELEMLIDGSVLREALGY